jgi:UDP-N-acetylmuramate--alanine ligase
MRGVGTDIGTIHFIGIGGIGMSGIAEVMHILGYKVQGSDVAEGYVVEGLRELGIPVKIGPPCPTISRGPAGRRGLDRDQEGQSELVCAYERRIPGRAASRDARRADAPQVHGRGGRARMARPPPPSMVAALLDAGRHRSTVINGGIINAYGSNARLGSSDWMVVEADESDGSFLRLDGTIAVVTNIDPEHLDHYGSFEKGEGRLCGVRRERALLRRCSALRRPPGVQTIIPRLRDRRVVTYGSRRRPMCAATTSRPFPAATAST